MPKTEPPETPPGTEPIAEGGYAFQERTALQPSLFPSEEVLLPDTLRNMRKAVSAIHTVPTRPDAQHTLSTRRLFDACILIAQVEIKRQNYALDRIRNERISPMFEVRTAELARLCGATKSHNPDRIHADLQRLYDMSLQWNVVGEDATTIWNMQSHFLSAIGIGKERKRGMVKFALDPEVLMLVLEPSNWASLSLQVMQGLGTEASYALFQNCWRYVGTQAKVTAALPTETWIELLLGRCGYIEVLPNGEKRAIRYADFKRRHLLDAIDRVNNVGALTYTLKLREIKSGNRVARLQFRFEPKQAGQDRLPLTWPKDVITALEHLGFNTSEISDIAQSRSFEEVAESLVKLKASEDRLKASGQRIGNKKAYFQGILTNVASGASVDALEHARIEAEIKTQEERQADLRRGERLREAFEKFRAQAFTDHLFNAEEPVRLNLFSRFEQDDAKRGHVAKPFLRKGWTPDNKPLMALLRDWMSKHDQESLQTLLPLPTHNSYEAWLAWRLEMASGHE